MFAGLCFAATVSYASKQSGSRVIEKEDTLSLIKFRLQYLTMILHALNICLCLQRSPLLTYTLGVDVPIGEDGGRHIESKCEWVFVLWRLLYV